jgi:hypothetical protein
MTATPWQDPRVGQIIDHLEILQGVEVVATAVEDRNGPRQMTIVLQDATVAAGRASARTTTPPADTADDAEQATDTRYVVVSWREIDSLKALVATHVPRGVDRCKAWEAAAHGWWTKPHQVDRYRDYLVKLLANVGIAPDGTDLDPDLSAPAVADTPGDDADPAPSSPAAAPGPDRSAQSGPGASTSENTPCPEAT